MIFIKNKISSAVIIAFIGLLFSGCVGGELVGSVYKSTDGGKVFEQKSKIDEKTNLANENVLSLKIDPNNTDIVYVGTLKSGIFRSVDGANSWVKDSNSFTNVNNIVISPTNSNIIYISAKKEGRGKILKTEDGGENWQEIYTENANGPHVLSMAIDPVNSNVLYFGDSVGGVFKTENGGESWENLFWAQSSVSVIAIDQINPNLIYFGTSSSGAMVSESGGRDFESIIRSGVVYNIVVDPSAEGVVYLSDKDGLKKSINKGKDDSDGKNREGSWKILNTIVKPDMLGARGIAINSQNNQEIFYTSGKAFYKSSNGGVNWSPTQLDIGNFAIKVIEINPDTPQIIYLGLYKSSGFKLFP